MKKLTLRALRVNCNLTQTQAADKLGITRSTLRSYETGVTFPDVITIKQIEKLYDVQFSDINFFVKNNT